MEELQARRKNLHIGMVKLAREDLSLTLQAKIDTHTVTPPSPSSASGFLTRENRSRLTFGRNHDLQ